MSNADSPWAAQMPKESGHRILHASLALDGNGHLYAGDAPENMPYERIKGVALTLNYETVEQAQRVFHALADGGKITMPQPTFWAKTWGMLIDKFGTPWIVNGERVQDTFWGGYAGYFQDPDHHLWEIAWNPAWEVKE